METFTEAKPFVNNPNYQENRKTELKKLERKIASNQIDIPIIEIVKAFNNIPYCFTLQCCHGHFIYNQLDSNNIEPLPKYPNENLKVQYHIAYIAFCLQNNHLGRKLFFDLKKITNIDPDYVHFGSTEWFWERCLNSYALQIEPERYKQKDKISIGMKEALHLEKLRNRMFEELKKILEKHQQLEI